jgi:hypothetical protein
MGWVVNATPRPCYTRERPGVPIVQDAGRVSRAQNLGPPEFDPRTVQPVPSPYTDWAIPVAYLLTLRLRQGKGYKAYLCQIQVFRAFSSVVKRIPGYNSQRWGTARTSQISFKIFYSYVRS